jgi:hypothetical protein
MCQVGHLQELYQDARSTEHKKLRVLLSEHRLLVKFPVKSGRPTKSSLVSAQSLSLLHG